MVNANCPLCDDGPMTDDQFIGHCDDEFDRIVQFDDLDNKAAYTITLVKELRQRVPSGLLPNSERGKVQELLQRWDELVQWSVAYAEAINRAST